MLLFLTIKVQGEQPNFMTRLYFTKNYILRDLLLTLRNLLTSSPLGHDNSFVLAPTIICKQTKNSQSHADEQVSRGRTACTHGPKRVSLLKKPPQTLQRIPRSCSNAGLAMRNKTILAMDVPTVCLTRESYTLNPEVQAL